MCEKLDYLGLPNGSRMVIFVLKTGLPVVSHMDYQKCQKHLFLWRDTGTIIMMGTIPETLYRLTFDGTKKAPYN